MKRVSDGYNVKDIIEQIHIYICIYILNNQHRIIEKLKRISEMIER